VSQQVLDAAKAPTVAYNDKNWDAVMKSVTADISYDEVGTNRSLRGVDDVITGWKGWATALPDSRATFDAAHVSGNTVILELTWRGTHRGTLRTPAGEIAATGKPIEIRACQIIDVKDGKVRSMRHYFDMVTMMAQLGVTPVHA
jgi:steroid delta-isomerase-like uncharacterized protein